MKQKQVHKSNWLVTMLLLVMAILMPYGGAWAQTKPSSGDGSVGKPYEISTAAELAWFRDYVNGTIVDDGEAAGTTHPSASATLTADIDLSEFCHAADDAKNPGEVSWTPIGNSDNIYQGTFDGNGKTIRNLYINATSDYTGFFGEAHEGGCIKNITFDNAKVKSTGDYSTGILAGDAGPCMIENIKTLANCSVEGKVYVGGIAGKSSSDIINCENHAEVKGTRFLGGVVGRYGGSGSITSCANYGAVTGTQTYVGGMAGYFASGTIQNSANYGDIKGTNSVGNLIGFADKCNLNNVLGTGNVTAISNTKRGGLLVGFISQSSSTASGILAYNSSAKLTINGTEQTGEAVRAIGEGSLTSADKIKAFTTEQLKSGLVAYLLQINVSGSARWGQKLGTVDYPLLGSADEVYLVGNVTMNCLGEVVGTGTFTNTKPAQEGLFTFKHGDSPTHHESVDATCTVDGKMEYWECDVCHASFSDAQLTQEVGTPVVSATGHEYDENDKCTKCQQEIPSLTSGDNNITIEKTYGERDKISGYNLYKFTAPEEGTLEVTANSNGKVTYGTLWESRTAASYLTYNGFGNGRDFKITYDVTAGTTYYIGARESNGIAIEGNVTLNVKLISNQPPTGMTGNGTEAEPFVLKSADHLAWFRDYVNGGHPNAWAKISDDVKAIDMSSVCHEAGTKYTDELSWTPIGNESNKYVGTFDGNDKIISNLYINATSVNTGFFGYATDGSIKNITFDNAKVKSTGSYDTAILAGAAEYCIIENIKTLANCSVEGNMKTGGIAGMAEGNISNCENHAMVKGSYTVGGVVGSYNGSSNISSCANYGAVTGTNDEIGGMVGHFSFGTIQNSANYGDITGTCYVGNLIGTADGCNLNNVLGTGNVIATSYTDYAGLLVGYANKSYSTASGILAYNSSAKLTIKDNELTGDAVKAIGEGSLTYPEGVNEADVIKAFTPEQLKSGEVAYLLNGSKSEGKLAWYQKLSGTDADAYPVLTATEGNTVYHGSFTYCDGTASSYSNSSSDSELIHVASATITSPVFDSANHIYHMGCSNENCPEYKYVADAEGKLEATESTDGKFYVEELNLTDATIINTQAQFTVKNLQYSRQLTKGQTGYASLCLPFDINVSDVTGAEECYPLGDMMIHLTANDGKLVNYILMLDKSTTIKAGTPMVVKLSAENADQSLVVKAQNVAYGANFLTKPAAKTLTLRDWDGKSGMMPLCKDLAGASVGGVYTTTALADGSYSLRYDGNFGIHTGDLSPYRMYLNIKTSQSASSRAMMFSIGMPDDSSTTGIRIISMGDVMQMGSAVKSAAIYTLEGQRVNGTPRKGIYIKNGKKFIVK